MPPSPYSAPFSPPSKAGCVSTALVLAFGMLPTDGLVTPPRFGRLRLPAGLSLSSSSRKSQWAEEAPVPSASKTRSRERAAARGEVLEAGSSGFP